MTRLYNVIATMYNVMTRLYNVIATLYNLMTTLYNVRTTLYNIGAKIQIRNIRVFRQVFLLHAL